MGTPLVYGGGRNGGMFLPQYGREGICPTPVVWEGLEWPPSYTTGVGMLA